MPVKTVTKTKVRTLDEAVMYMTESIAEMARSKAESDAKIAESQAKTDLAIKGLAVSQAVSRAETDKAIQRMSDRIDALSVEVAETTKSVKEIVGGLTQNVKEIVGGFGRVNNRLGYLIEFIVAPGIRHEMNALGFRFSRGKPNKIFHGIINGKKEIIAEVDMLLTNGKEVMAAEVKTSLTVTRVKECLDKIAELRDYEEYTKIQGKKLYGAVVGLDIEPDARAYALKNGLYVLKIEERDKLLIPEKPKRPRTW